jgi:hypothetical protein
MAGMLGVGAGTGPMNFNNENDPEPNVSPEEQKQYDLFVHNGMELIYTKDGKILPEVLQRLSRGKPIQALAQTAVWLVMMVENSAKQNGLQITDDVIMHGGEELLEQLAEIAEKAHIHSFTQGELQGAWYNALDMYREANTGNGGRFNPQEAASEFQQLNAADQEGKADEVLPGFSSAEQATMQAAQEQSTKERGGDQQEQEQG